MADDVTKKDLQTLEKNFNKQIADVTKQFGAVDDHLQGEIAENAVNLINSLKELRQAVKDHDNRIRAIEQQSRS